MNRCYEFRPVSRQLIGLFFSVMLGMAGVVKADNEIGQLIDQGSYQDALRLIDEQAKQETADQAALGLLKGAVLVRMGRLDDGMMVFQALAERHPNDAAIQNNIGVIYAEKGELDQAREGFEKALKISPDYEQANSNLGDVYAELACRTYGRIPEGSTFKAPSFCEPVDEVQVMLPSKESAKPAEEMLTDVLREEVLETLESWRAVWEAQNVDSYLSFYSVRFAPKGVPLSKWRIQRERSLKRPDWIKIVLENPNVAMTKTGVTVRVLQRYSASNYRDVVTKELTFIREDAGWKIIRERII